MSGLARYRVLRPIREGGAFDVLEAVVLGAGDFERRVALKRVRKEDEGVDEANEAILTEARLAGRLRHANIVATIDAGLDEEGLAYLAMDYVDGLDAGALWRRGEAAGHPMPPQVAVHVVTEVAHALDYVHGATDRDGRALSMVHRDVTPANVMISWSGDVLLTDFGIARGILSAQRTAAGLSKGTLDFMAPEQVTGGHIDQRADIFGLGALLHCLLAGRSPTQGLDMAARARGQRVVDPSLAPALQRVVLRATAPNRAERYLSAGELAQDLWRAGLAAPAGGGRAALHGWLGALRSESAPAAAPGVAALFALDLPPPSGVLGAAPLHLGTAVHAPPQSYSSLVSFAEEEDASTAEGARVLAHRTERDVWRHVSAASTGLDDATDAAMTVHSGSERLLLADGEVRSAAALALDRLAPVRLAGTAPPDVERTHVARPPRTAPYASASPAAVEDTRMRRLSEPPSGTSPTRTLGAHVEADGVGPEDFGPAATATAAMTARGGRRMAYAVGLAAVALTIVGAVVGHLILAPPEPLVPVDGRVPPAGPAPATPTVSAALGAPRSASASSAPGAEVPVSAPPSPSSSPREVPVAAASRADTAVRSSPRASPASSPRAAPRTSRVLTSPAPAPPTVARAAPATAAERLDALGRQLKVLAQAGGPTDELQALESEYFRLRRASPQTPADEQAHARAVEALWARVERAAR